MMPSQEAKEIIANSAHRKTFCHPVEVEFKGYELFHFMRGWSCGGVVKQFVKPVTLWNDSKKRPVLESRRDEHERALKAVNDGHQPLYTQRMHHCLKLLCSVKPEESDRVGSMAHTWILAFVKHISTLSRLVPTRQEELDAERYACACVEKEMGRPQGRGGTW